MTIVDDIERLQGKYKALEDKAERLQSTIAKQDEQLNGERGISKTLNSLADEIHGLRKAAYWLIALIVTSSIGFAFSVLVLLPDVVR